MSDKPVVAMALSRAVYEMMFTPQDLRHLEPHAQIIGPPETGSAEQIAPLLHGATVAITGFGIIPCPRDG